MADESRAAADAVWSFLAPGYGPYGGHRLLDMGDDVQLLHSSASGLNEQALEAALVPFQNVVRSVQSTVGDQATAAGLIASGLVKRGLDAEEDGLQRPTIVDGLRLARRQASGLITAMATATDPQTALAYTTGLDPAAVEVVVRGVQDMANDHDGFVALDDVDIRVEPAQGPSWSEGLVATPQHGPDLPRRSDVGVVVCDGGWTIKSRSDGVGRHITSPAMLDAAKEEEHAMRQDVADHMTDLGCGLLVCGGALDDGLSHSLAQAGVWVWTDAPKDARRRLVASTGATAVPDLDHIDDDAMGRADVSRRPRRQEGHWVVGPGPSATLLLPGTVASMQAAVADDGERLLRAAGVALLDARSIPGGGRWQRQVAQGLRDASVHAPGKQALVVELAADVFAAMADALVANAGGDPLDQAVLSDTVVDAAPCVEAAVMAGFDAAITMLRIDGRYDKRPSTPKDIRGGTGPSGSPKGMPGDIPPLM